MKKVSPKRLVKWLLVAVAGLFAAYLVAINVFLSTRLFDLAINGTPMTIDIHFRRGWSIWPGLVQARDLSIRSRDGNVEFMLRIERVRFRVSLFQLAKQRFVVSGVRGSGVTFRLRSRLDPWEVTPARLEGIPPIEGLSPVPVRPFQQCSLAEGSDAYYHLWTIDLEDVAAEDVRDIWVDRRRFQGLLAVDGHFYLKPLRRVEIGPIHVVPKDLGLSEVGVETVNGIAGTGDLTVDPFDPRAVGGKAILQQILLRTDLRMKLPDVARMNLPLPGGVKVRGPVAFEKFAIGVDHGKIGDGSRVDAAAPQAVVERGDDRLTTSLVASAEVKPGDQHVEVRGTATDVRYSHGRDADLALVPRVDMTARARPIASNSRIDLAHLTVDAPGIQVPDLHALVEALASGAGAAIERGRARADVRAEAWPDDARAVGRASMQAEDVVLRSGKILARGTVAVDVPSLTYEWEAHRLDAVAEARANARVASSTPGPFEGDVRAVVQARSIGPDGSALDLSGSAVALRNVSVRGEAAPDSRADAILQGATLQLVPPAFRGVVSADVMYATPLLAPVRDKIPGPFRSLTDIPRLLATARLSYSQARMRIDAIDAHGGALSARGLYGARGSDRLGAFVIEGGPIPVGLGVDPEGTHIRIFGLSGWLVDEQQRVSEKIGGP